LFIEKRFSDASAIKHALAQTSNPVTQALLLPFVPQAAIMSPVVAPESLVEKKLRVVEPASPLHRSLVEVIRRQYKVFCQERDHADKASIRAAERQTM
jgi:hypothetical protein